jgi:cytochrome c-type biogenesis protein CcmH
MRRRMRVYAPWILLVVVVAGALLWAQLGSSATSSPTERTRALAEQLRCLECQGLSVADSHTTTAEAIKTDIRRRIDAGESNATIKQAYVDRYGEFVLLSPSSSYVALWWIPVFLIGAGGIGVGVVLVRNARKPRRVATDAERARVAASQREQDHL